MGTEGMDAGDNANLHVHVHVDCPYKKGEKVDVFASNVWFAGVVLRITKEELTVSFPDYEPELLNWPEGT